MNLSESFSSAIVSLRANLMRSLLTMLGIIIGVGAVITTVALGEGAQRSVKENLQKLGSNLLFVRPGNQTFGGVVISAGSSITLTEDDAIAIKRRAKFVESLSPESRKGVQAKFGNKNWNTTVVGVYPEYETVRNATLSAGRYFTEADNKAMNAVCVIGPTVAQNLFERGVNPVGQTIRINNVGFQVLGVLEEKGSSGWQNPDDQILAPLNTVQKRLAGATWISGITIKVVSEEKMTDALLEVEQILRKQHRLRNDQDNDFTIRNQSDLVSAFSETSRILAFLLTSVAVVSLVVGGIGIMNIMLVSVTERTREIGIRKAIGAKKRDILSQFLIESTVLALAGGALGILLGIGVSELLGQVSTFRTVISIESIFVSFLFSGLVGIFFGFYPAQKAASADPIEALRYE
ncbi:MAG: ABC transporter permease [Chloroherpetonaceae bacterium]|nr:ABC transporter permease [Chloroherpetonaceae bacterium]MDW8437302.1 ABC transporter permease [Chloroherpetonaceae bacterium]